LAPFAFLVEISANQIAGNIRVTGSYKTTNTSQNVFQKFAITDFKPFQQKTIDALLSDKDIYLSVKTIVKDFIAEFTRFHGRHVVVSFLDSWKSSSKIRFDRLRYFMNIHTKRVL